MKSFLDMVLRWIFLAGCCAILSACGGAFGQANITSPGNTPPVPPETTFQIVGTIGTPFSAKISDARSSWTVNGVVPLTIIIVNNQLPGRMVVTKLRNDSSLLSAEIVNGFTVEALASTTQPFGSAVVQSGSTVGPFPPAAFPDVRFFVKGPNTAVFNGLIEDIDTGFSIQARAPALFLFDSPNGRVSGNFSLISVIGPFSISLTINGTLVDSATGGPNVTLSHG
jgi:hypothetical protein